MIRSIYSPNMLDWLKHEPQKSGESPYNFDFDPTVLQATPVGRSEF